MRYGQANFEQIFSLSDLCLISNFHFLYTFSSKQDSILQVLVFFYIFHKKKLNSLKFLLATDIFVFDLKYAFGITLGSSNNIIKQHPQNPTYILYIKYTKYSHFKIERIEKKFVFGMFNFTRISIDSLTV